MEKIDLFKRDIQYKKAIKVIAGINNFDKNSVLKVVKASDIAFASAVDIAFDESIICEVKEITSLPVFVSSVVPEELFQAVELGADAVEIGNFDALYRNGIRISASKVLNILEETLELLKDNRPYISVTIPGHIEISEQISLLKEIELLNVDLIQTEGAATVLPDKKGARGLLQAAEVSISNTIELVKNTSLPIMTSSGITPTTAPLAFASGASAIGIGSCVNKLNNIDDMVQIIKSVVSSVSRISDRVPVCI